MTVGIYARKSTDQDVEDAEKSVARQIQHARAYATRRGWVVDEASIFSDDGISGAEWGVRRPGLSRMMDSLNPRPRFQVLIMSEESRLGRESTRTMNALSEILRAGVRVFFYLEDRELQLGSFQDNTMAFLRAEFASEERRKAAQRTHDALLRKFMAGHVVGGRVFGYDNVEVSTVVGRRSHVVRRVSLDEAAVVRRIFTLCAEGVGQVRIARMLNAEGARAPQPRKGGPRAWAPSSVREVLFREEYRGRAVWNRKRKRNDWGAVQRAPKPEAAWYSIDRPDLRVVSDAEWDAAHGRLARARAEYDEATHGLRKRTVDRESKYLLVGFSRCGICGGKLCVQSRSKGKRGRLGRTFYYRCTSNLLSGASVCRHGQLWPMEAIDDAVLTSIAGHTLTADVVEEVIVTARSIYAGERLSDRVVQARKELDVLDRTIANLTDAIVAGGQLPSLVARLTDAEGRRAELSKMVDTVRVGPAPAWREIERRIRQNLAAWKATILSDVVSARGAFRELLSGPISFMPVIEQGSRKLRYEGRIGLAALLGEAGASLLVTRAGIEPVTL